MGRCLTPEKTTRIDNIYSHYNCKRLVILWFIMFNVGIVHTIYKLIYCKLVVLFESRVNGYQLSLNTHAQNVNIVETDLH